ERIFRRLTEGAGLPALVVSVIAGVATLGLVWRRRYEPARYTAAVAVAATIAGWAVAQNPVFLQGLTIRQAAAGHDTLVAVIVAILGGALLLFPSLALLFRLTLGGELRGGEQRSGEAPVGSRHRALVSDQLDARRGTGRACARARPRPGRRLLSPRVPPPCRGLGRGAQRREGPRASRGAAGGGSRALRDEPRGRRLRLSGLRLA